MLFFWIFLVYTSYLSCISAINKKTIAHYDEDQLWDLNGDNDDYEWHDALGVIPNYNPSDYSSAGEL
jgi:hypothetical protein